MFEAVLTLCLGLAGETCRDVLIPGHRSETRAACAASLGTVEVDATRFAPQVAAGAPHCVPEGPRLSVVEVAPGLFVHAGQIAEPDTANGGDVANLGFVVGADAVAVIDSGAARWMGEALLRTIRAETDLPVSHVILTHMHPDHVLGASVLSEAGAEVVGHARLARALSDRRANYLESLARLIGPGRFLGTDIVLPGTAVEAQMRIDLGGRALTLTAWPTAHTGTDLTVRDSRTGLVFAGDLIFDQHIPALDGSLRGWQTALAALMDEDLPGVVPGHGAVRLDWPEGGLSMVRYLDVLARDTRASIDAGERLGEAITHIAESERDAWALFDAYNPRNATTAFTELEWE